MRQSGARRHRILRPVRCSSSARGRAGRRSATIDVRSETSARDDDGDPSVGLPPPAAAAPAPPPPAPAAEAPHVSARSMGTMIGMPAADLGVAPAAAAAPPPLGNDAAMPPDEKRTLLGVAIPGVAPTQSSPPPADPRDPHGQLRTMLGVAIPGVAPTHSNNPPMAPVSARPKPMAALPPIVPAPPPLQLEAVPAPMQHAPKKGFPRDRRRRRRRRRSRVGNRSGRSLERVAARARATEARCARRRRAPPHLRKLSRWHHGDRRWIDVDVRETRSGCEARLTSPHR